MKKSLSLMLVALLLLSIIPTVLAWEMERPSNGVIFVKEREENATTNGEATVGLGVNIESYAENHGTFHDGLWLRISATANTRKGMTYDWRDYSNSYSWIDIDKPGLNPEVLMSPGNPESFVQIYLAASIRFYGGHRSGEYSSLWVSKNGVLCFDNRLNDTPPLPEPDPYYSNTIPNTDEPNAFVAPFWRELNPQLGGKVLYVDQVCITPPGGGPNCNCAVISWIDVPDKSCNPQTFQVIIGLYRPDHEYAQNRIWFQYKSVTFDEEATIGIEDHGGWEGVSIDSEIPPAIQEDKAIEIRQWSNCFTVSTLTIKLSSNDPYSNPKIIEHAEWIRGYNIILNQTLPDDTLRYALALGGVSTLLIDVIDIATELEVTGVGLLMGGGLVILEEVDMYARAQAEAKLLGIDPGYRWAEAHADGDVVDASFNLPAYWEFLDWETNDENHWLNVTTELTYIECHGDGEYVDTNTISTSTVLRVVRDAGNSIDDPNVRVIEPGTYKAFVGVNVDPPGFNDVNDYYEMWVEDDHVINITMKPGNNNFDLYLYDPAGAEVKSSTNSGNATEEISYVTTCRENWIIRVKAVAGDGIYTLTVDEPYPAPKLTVRTYTTGGSPISGVAVWIDTVSVGNSPVTVAVLRGTHTVKAQDIFEPGDGYRYVFKYWNDYQYTWANPRTVNIADDMTLKAYYEKRAINGGCPYVYVWNGTDYVIDNNLLGYSEVTNGTDVEDYYRLEQTLVPTYQGRWFSRYSLLISEFEQEHSHIDKVKLLALDHDSDVNIAVSPYGEFLTYREPSPPISCIDNHGNNQLAIISTIDDNYYRSHPEDYLIVDFGDLDISSGAKLVLRANANFKKELCIHVQVIDLTGSWMDVIALRTRERWATEIVDLSSYLPDANGELKVRLYFTGMHHLDYIGLDTSLQQDFEVHHALLTSAIHSTEGNVKWRLLLSDNIYAELIPNQQIELTFQLLNNREEARTFIIYIEGHYCTINS